MIKMILPISILIEISLFSLIHGYNLYLDNSFVLITIIIDSFALIFDLTHDRKIKEVSILILVAYCFRLLLLYLDLGVSSINLPGSGADTERFFREMTYVASGASAHRFFFVTVFGYLFRITGVSRLFAQYLLLLMSIMAIKLTYLTMLELDISRKKRIIALAMMCLLPNYACMSVILLRESPISLCITISVYYFVKWYNSNREKYFLYALLAIAFAAVLHSGTIAVAIGMFVARLFYDKKNNQLRVRFANIIFFAIGLLVFVYFYNRYENTVFYKFSDLDSISDIAAISTRGNSSYAQYVGNSETLFNLIIYTPLRMFFYLFSPMPWQWRGVTDLIAFLFNSCFFAFVIIMGIKKIRSDNLNNKVLLSLLLFIAFSVTFVFAWGVSNTGTALRHRDKVIALFIIILSLTDNKKGSING